MKHNYYTFVPTDAMRWGSSTSTAPIYEITNKIEKVHDTNLIINFLEEENEQLYKTIEQLKEFCDAERMEDYNNAMRELNSFLNNSGIKRKY